MPRSAGAARGAIVASREVRSDKDFYETPVACATEICYRLKRDFHLSPAVVLEPSAGSGNFIQAIHAVWPMAHVIAVDILAANVVKCGRVAKRTDEIIRADIMEIPDSIIARAELAIGNPPFSQAEEHIERILRALSSGVRLSFLLPTSFITTQGRARGLYNNPADGNGDARGPYGELEGQAPLAERPGFTTNGKTDMAEYASYTWQKDRGHYNPHLLPHIWWRHRLPPRVVPPRQEG